MGASEARRGVTPPLLPVLLRSSPPRIFVGDTGALLREVRQGLINGRLTSLLAALHQGSARLYISSHVLDEINRDADEEWVQTGLPPGAIRQRWLALYLPMVGVVDVEPAWGRGLEPVEEVARRHQIDLPTAQLAVALAPCCVIAEDRDLITYGFGHEEWLQVTHASANQAIVDQAATVVYIPSRLALEGLAQTADLVRRAPTWLKLVLLLATAGAVERWRRDNRPRRQLDALRGVASEVGERVLPTLTTIASRVTAGNQAWAIQSVSVPGYRTLSEMIAAALALAEDAMTAGELARLIENDGSIADRTVDIRNELAGSLAFVQVRRGRWQLGHRQLTPLSPVLELSDWFGRALVPGASQ